MCCYRWCIWLQKLTGECMMKIWLVARTDLFFCVQVLNNFNAFYVTHQIFFLVFVLLFLLHPVPKYSHVHGKRTYLPVPYTWVRSPLHNPPHQNPSSHILHVKLSFACPTGPALAAIYRPDSFHLRSALEWLDLTPDPWHDLCH